MSGILLSSSRRSRIAATVVFAAAGLAIQVTPVFAQLDPTLFLKRSTPNILVVVDTANRMQRDAPTDQGNSQATSNYYDPFTYSYTVGGAAWETALGVDATMTTYRRRYGFRADGTCADGTTTCGFNYSNSNGDKFTAGSIVTVGSTAGSSYASFFAPTRLAIARAALYQAIKQNQNVARFGLIKMRQNTPTMPAASCNTLANCQVNDLNPLQSGALITTESGTSSKWFVTRPTVSGTNGAAPTNGNNSPVLIAADSATANADLLTILSKAPADAATGSLKPLIPAGNDDASTIDAPIKYMLDDTAGEAIRLIGNDLSNGNGGQQCRNTVVILVVGGGEGNTAGNPDPTTTAAAYLAAGNWAGRHVPIYVVALAPPASDRTQLQNIASKSGGMYFEVTKAEIDAALNSSMWSAATMNARVAGSLPDGTVEVPEAVRAINLAIQSAFENFADLNTATAATWTSGAGVPPVTGDFKLQIPQLIPGSEFQVTTPIIGTVNSQGMKDINGALLTPDPSTVKDRQGNVIPQRSNLMLTAAFGLPGFDGRIRAYRVYKPVVDATQPSGYKFQSDGTPLWVACAPGTTDTGPCSTTTFPTTNSRNLYTTDSSGQMIAFTTANVATLAPLMNLSATDASNVINIVRSQPLGTILDSTPAVMNQPSLDPPPDDTYPAFAVAQKDRRAMIWVGTNRGIFEGIDARSGIEVWGYIPMNLLPKLRTLWDGQAVGSTDFLMDGSPKISDIRLADGSWKTYMFLSQGAGGNFYQTFDVTLDSMGSSVPQTDDNINDVLTYFSSPTVVPMKWSFPSLAHWEPNCANTGTLGANVCATSPYGDLTSGATSAEKTVGQTWSDPAIGQVGASASPYVMLAGSGYMPYSMQQQANRGGTVGGTTFYMFNAQTGALLASKDVGSDGTYETQDNCSNATNPGGTPGSDCRYFKNALHSDPVATGPSDSRFITKAYIGDLDGRVWRFDISLNSSNVPIFNSGTNPTMLYSDALKQPIFASMATVNVGGTQQYIFTGTGSDLLPANGVAQQYRLLGILDNGSTGSKTFEYDLVKVDNTAGDEKVTTFPAVAGDIVFFTTTTFNPATPCVLPTASLYALTFIGGPAYDTNNDGKFSSQDSVLVASIAGTRATAPFIVDQHLVFGTQGKVQIYGNDSDYNNGIGQAGVRLLSWREVR
jgi:hypothetical protein